MPKNILKFVALFAMGMAGGIFSEQIFWPYFVERPLFYKYGLDNPPVYVTETKQVIIQENAALTTAIENVEQSVIGIKTLKSAGVIVEGSGLIITSDGLAVTLAELAPQNSVPLFYVDGKQEKFQVLKRDLKNNLALIKIDKANLKTASFASLDDLNIGEKVFLVGTVFEGQKISRIANEGIVRSFDEKSIQTNIAERYTLAGSPLFNIKGEVLGLNTIDSAGRVITVPISIIKEFAAI